MKTFRFLSSLMLCSLLWVSGRALAADVPSVVLVHGAFADGSNWSKVIPILQAKGIQVTAVQMGLDSLSSGVATTRRAIDDQKGRVVLVGHSWGGSVITEAGQDDKVVALVYVAAFALDAGQSTGEVGKDFPPPPGGQHLVADSKGWLSLPPQAFVEDFAPDVPAAQAAVMAVTQGPLQAKAFGDRPSVAAWKTRPSWYIVSSNDRMIPPDLERAMASKIGATTTTIASSHVPQLSHPEEVAAVILAAVAATTK